MAFFGQNYYGEAETLFAKALALGDQGAGMPPADFARILRGYARCLRKLGSKDDAKSLDSRAKAILGAPPGPGDFCRRRQPTNPDQVREAAESLSQRIVTWAIRKLGSLRSS